MFGIGLLELCVIAVIFVVFVGPKKLPEVMRNVGKFFVHAKRMSNEVKSTIDNVVYEAEREMHLENLKKIDTLTKGSINEQINKVINDDGESANKTDQIEESSKEEGHDHHAHMDHDEIQDNNGQFESEDPFNEKNSEAKSVKPTEDSKVKEESNKTVY